MPERTAADRGRAVGLDVGGSLIKVGVISRDGDLLSLQKVQTPPDAAPDSLAGEMIHLIHDVCIRLNIDPATLDGIGISLAGFVTADGVVTATAHLSREWIGYDLKARLQGEIDADYYFALDTPAPTLGEAYYGAGKGISDFVYVTVSTGIGAGIVAGGEYFIGGLGWAGGVGHTIIDEKSNRVCEGCGNHGCLETFAAKQGIVATAEELSRLHPESLLSSYVAAGGTQLTPEVIFQVADEGDKAACEVFRLAGHALGIGITNLVDMVAPQRVVIGGGIAQAGDLLLDPVREVVRQRAFPPQLRDVEIVQAELGDLSGMFGAAAMVFHDLRINPGGEA